MSRLPPHVPLLAALVATACTAEVDGPGYGDDAVGRAAAIIGGAGTSENPAVGVLYSNNGKVCSGFLISSNVVVTAAHCFDGSAPAWFGTGEGEPVSAPDLVPSIGNLLRHPIERFVRHPHAHVPGSASSAAYPWQYDFAYAILETPVSIAPLPYGGGGVANGSTCLAVGYGLDSEGSGGHGGRKKQGLMRVVSQQSVAGHGLLNVTWGDSSTYRGDSGGPLLCDGNAVGVFSYISNLSDRNSLRYYGATSGVVKAWFDGAVSQHNPSIVPTTDAGGVTGGSPGTGGGGPASGWWDAGAPGNAPFGVPRPPGRGAPKPQAAPTSAGGACHAAALRTENFSMVSALLLAVAALLFRRRGRRLPLPAKRD